MIHRRASNEVLPVSVPDGSGWSMPYVHPFYPPLPASYRDVRAQLVFFESEPDAVARFLPEPLEPSPDGLCLAAGIEVPFCSAYGAFNEAFLMLKARFREADGWYIPIIWHDGPAGIAAGREIYGAPKVFASIEIGFDGTTMRTVASMDGITAVTITSTSEEPIPPSALPSLAPDWRLKVIPRADGPGPALKQLVDASGANTEVTVAAASRARGTVTFGASPNSDFTALNPRASGDAYFSRTSFREGYGRIVYDYLTGEAADR
jgi:acetoacetate decarboxylase